MAGRDESVEKGASSTLCTNTEQQSRGRLSLVEWGGMRPYAFPKFTRLSRNHCRNLTRSDHFSMGGTATTQPTGAWSPLVLKWSRMKESTTRGSCVSAAEGVMLAELMQ